MAESKQSPRYTIDASSLIQGWRVNYSPDVFPGVWEKLEGLVEQEMLVASEEVLVELARKEDGLYKWAKRQNGMFRPHTAAIQNAVKDILRQHRQLLHMRKNRSGADPFVIAVGLVEGRAVVTQEGRSGNPSEKPHIPDVCDANRVRWLPLLDLLREQGYTFRSL